MKNSLLEEFEKEEKRQRFERARGTFETTRRLRRAARTGGPQRVDAEDMEEVMAALDEEIVAVTTEEHTLKPYVKPMRLLVLFCGTGSVERVFKEMYPGCEVVTVDIESKWKPTHTADILEWDYSQYPRHYFDVIWASPPCTEYSVANTQGERLLHLADARVRRTKDIITYLDPTYWFFENPRGGAHGLSKRQVSKSLGQPYLTHYCRHGCNFQKPTYIWTNAPISGGSLPTCTAADPCETRAFLGRHRQTAQSGPTRGGTPGSGNREAVYGLPAPLLRKRLFPNLRQVRSRKRRSYLLALYHGLLGPPEPVSDLGRSVLPGGDILFTLNGVSERWRTPGDSAGRGTVKSLYFLGPEGVTAKEGSSNSETRMEEEF
jgi:hypothetical protein